MRNLSRLFLSFFLITLFSVISFSQGIIKGKISDEQTGEELIGVNVLILDTKYGASTDLDGEFLIKNLPAGLYSLKCSYIGYSVKTIENITVENGKPITLNISLSSEAVKTSEFVVTADAIYSSESALLNKRKNVASISDAISSEQMKRSTDATTGDALKRVTGLSIVDNKFVFIRGITDRYNTTTIDGATVTSTVAGKKGFSFDLLPSNLVENIVVIKSATPDMPADFSGGMVQINTLDFPTARVVKVSLGSALNTVTTGKSFNASQGGNKDWLGADDGTRSFPENATSISNIPKVTQNTWAPLAKTAPVNTNFSLTVGDRIDFDTENPSNGKLGIIGSYSYKNSFQRNESHVPDVELGRDYSGTNDEFSVLWGAILNLSYQFDGLHKISFKNNINRSGIDNVKSFQGSDINTSLENNFTVINWTERSSYTGQVNGEHNFPSLQNLNFQWKGSVSSSRRDDPDRKEVTYYRDVTDPTQPFTVAVNQRSWAYLNDRTFSFSTDFSLPISTFKLKLGSHADRRTSNYRIRYFNVTPDYQHGIPDSLTHLPLESVYAPENFGPKKFLFSESSKPTDSYEGNQDVYDFYLMGDIPFSISDQLFRLTGGARLDNCLQDIYVAKTYAANGPVDHIQHKTVDVLPSLNFAYVASSSINLRFAYAQSVNRPELQEIAPTSFYDFIKYELIGGNPNLNRALVRSYDIRFELFPGLGELFAISYFKKDFTDAIEQQYFSNLATRTRTWVNSPTASNFGWEIEFRKSLSFFGGYFQNFSLIGNYTRVESKVEISENRGNSSQTILYTYERPLQGQSPYTINLSILFTEPTLGTSINILYNTFGSRLDAVGVDASDIYEEPRDLIDIALTQPIGQNVEAKVAVKNLNDKDRIFTRGGQLYEQTSLGKTYSLQFSYNF